MRTQVYEFEWGTDPEYGNEGWLPKGRPDFNAGDARLLTHDCLEHPVRPHHDAAVDELMALGAAIFVRGETGADPRLHSGEYSFAEHIRVDIVQVFGRCDGEVPALRFRIPEGRGGSLIEEVLDGAIEAICEEWGRRYVHVAPAFLRTARAAMTIGYRLARARFGCHQNARECWDALCGHIERLAREDRQTGEPLRVTVHPKAGRVSVETWEDLLDSED